MKFNETFTEILRLDLESGIVPFLAGEPGIGKSSIVKSMAAAMNSRVFVVMCNQMADKGDLTGARLMPTSDGSSYEQRFFPHHKVKAAVDYAIANPRDTVILMLDEINRTTPDVTSAALTISTERELGDVVLPDNLKVVVAGNDKGNVTSLDEASLSRFAVYHVEPDANTLIAHLGDSLNPWVKAVLAKQPHLVFAKSTPSTFATEGKDDDDDDSTTTATFADLSDAGEEMLQLTTPRTIEHASKWLNAIDRAKLQELVQTQVKSAVDEREMTLLQEVLEAKLGNTGFTTLLVSEVIDALSSGTVSATPSMSVPKPNCFKLLKEAGTISALDDLVSTLTDTEKSASLLYAMYERADNAMVIAQLAASTTAFDNAHNRKLIELASHGMLDDSNVEAFYAANTTLSAATQGLISVFSA